MKLLVFLFSIIHLNQCHNFLVFSPLFAHSHATFLAKVADTLTNAGHNVTYFCPLVAKRYRDKQYVKTTKNIVMTEPDDELAHLGELMDSSDFSQFWTKDGSALDNIEMEKFFQSIFVKLLEVLRDNKTILDELKKNQYDAIIFEPFVEIAISIQQYLGIKTILPAFSMTHYFTLQSLIGEPALPLVTAAILGTYGDKMNLLQRINNVYHAFIEYFLITPMEVKSLLKKDELIDISSEMPKAPFLFVNSNPFLNFQRPMISKTISIGGVTVNAKQLKAQKVDEEWNKILNFRPQTILVSFGSFIQSMTMPNEYRTTLRDVIAKFPNVTFIWKYEDSDKSWAEGVPNLVISPWVPQTSLLADRRLTAFVTHGGLGSTTELAYLGKPSIMIPIFVDQIRNAHMLAQHNGSIVLTKYDLANSRRLENAFKNILNDSSYKENAEILARQLERQPIKPEELLVKYSEFAVEFGELPALDPHYRTMSMISYFMIDIILIFLLSLLLVIFIIKKSLNVILSHLSFKVKVKKS